MKKALITGITGQDGAYLAEFLLDKGYEVHGIKRRASLVQHRRGSTTCTRTRTSENVRFRLHYGDLTDATNLIRIIQEVQPDEIYNLAAQSHVAVSFETPGVHRQCRRLGHPAAARGHPHPEAGGTRPASTRPPPPSCTARCRRPRRRRPRPSIRARPTAWPSSTRYWITVNYREAYGLFACNGILFNHESPIRGETFVTRKITRGSARIKTGLQECSTSATSTPSATGATRGITCARCG